MFLKKLGSTYANERFKLVATHLFYLVAKPCVK